MEYLKGSGVEVDQGILVDERMRTSVSGSGRPVMRRRQEGSLNPQDPERHPAQCGGAGTDRRMDMVNDPALKVHQGAVALNTYKFFVTGPSLSE